jgi:hypothetical protein
VARRYRPGPGARSTPPACRCASSLATLLLSGLRLAFPSLLTSMFKRICSFTPLTDDVARCPKVGMATRLDRGIRNLPHSPALDLPGRRTAMVRGWTLPGSSGVALVASVVARIWGRRGGDSWRVDGPVLTRSGTSEALGAGGSYGGSSAGSEALGDGSGARR